MAWASKNFRQTSHGTHILFKHRSDSKASELLINYDDYDALGHFGHGLFRLLWLWRFLCLLDLQARITGIFKLYTVDRKASRKGRRIEGLA